jgi:hypothetical protein
MTHKDSKIHGALSRNLCNTQHLGRKIRLRYCLGQISAIKPPEAKNLVRMAGIKRRRSGDSNTSEDLYRRINTKEK